MAGRARAGTSRPVDADPAGADDAPPAVAAGPGSRRDLRRPNVAASAAPAVAALAAQEGRHRFRRQWDFVQRVWGATRRLIESVEDGARAALAARFYDGIWRYNRLPRRAYGPSGGVERASQLAGAAATLARYSAESSEPFANPIELHGLTRSPLRQEHAHAPFGSPAAASAAASASTPHRAHPNQPQTHRQAGARSTLGSLPATLAGYREMQQRSRGGGAGGGQQHSGHRTAPVGHGSPVLPVVNPIVMAAELRPPLCYDDEYCPDYAHPVHARHFRHTCRANSRCALINDAAHRRLYDHDAVDGDDASIVMMLD